MSIAKERRLRSRRAYGFCILRKNKIRRIDKRLRRSLLRESIFLLPRQLALASFLLYAETHTRAIAGQPNTPEAPSEVIQFGAFFIEQYCPEDNLTVRITPRAWKAAGEFFERLRQYVIISDLLLMMYSGKVAVKSKRQKHLLLRYSETFLRRRAAAQLFWGSPANLIGPPRNVVLAILDATFVLNHSNSFSTLPDQRLSFSLDQVARDSYAMNLHTLLRPDWEFSPDWPLGGYTVAEFRESWISLCSIAMAQIELARAYAHLHPTQAEFYLDQRLRITTRQDWITLISNLSGVTQVSVAALVDDLTFDAYAVDRPDKTPPQVLFRISQDNLILSRTQLFSAHPEEAIARIVQVRRPQQFSQLTNTREAFQVNRVANLLPPNVQAFPSLPVNHQGRATNLDLLLVDTANRFALSCELKWPLGPQWLRSASTTRNTLHKGFSQSKLCVDWLCSQPMPLVIQQQTGIKPEAWSTYDIRPIVISNRVFSGNFTDDLDPSVPLINEQILATLSSAPHNCSLGDIWQTAMDEGYLPREGQHYQIQNRTHTFKDYAFECMAMEGQPLQRFLDQDLTISRVNRTSLNS